MRQYRIPLILAAIDFFIVVTAPYLALLIRFEGVIEPHYFGLVAGLLPVAVLFRLGIFYLFGLYRRLWRYAGINELIVITGAVTVSTIVIMAHGYLTGVALPRSVQILAWFINIMLIGGSRLMVRIAYYVRQQQNSGAANVLIVGAGDAGAMIAREIQQRQQQDRKKLAGFIDDDLYKQHKMLFGVQVLGGRKDIARVVREHGIREIIIAMPSAGGSVIREIVKDCKKTDCIVRMVPGIYELIDGRVTVQQLRNVALEDLLRRASVQLETEQLAGYLSGKRVLVTGAGGSIGSELCRQVAKLRPHEVILLGKGENSIYEIHRELSGKYPDLSFIPLIADVRDQARIQSVFRQYKPQVVLHAAAHKHVPLMEAQPEEAVRNNIFGTKTVADAANQSGVEVFIMISTDKAVNPTSVMGATKRAAELIIQHMNSISKTKFAAVRFGNVLGSRGSVIPLFRKQIARGGPVTITHPEMKRYFMTIPEASQLVLQAGALAQGGEVFVLDMGEPVKIVDMARDLIELSGLVPDRDIAIEFTGLRPGEKLFEELLTAEEGTTATRNKKIYVANLKMVDGRKLQRGLMALHNAQSASEVLAILDELLPSYCAARRKYCQLSPAANRTMPQETEEQYRVERDLALQTSS